MTTTQYGYLYDSETTDRIRPATQEEMTESREAGPEGNIRVEIDGQSRRVYVDDWQTIEIVSGEGYGNGTIETYTGAVTIPAITARLARERCDGDRWAFARIDGERVHDADLDYVLRNTQ